MSKFQQQINGVQVEIVKYDVINFTFVVVAQVHASEWQYVACHVALDPAADETGVARYQNVITTT